MNVELERVVRPPALGFEEVKARLISAHPELASNPLARKGVYDALEVFGQSESIRSGFRKFGMQAVSFDYRSLAFHSTFGTWAGKDVVGIDQ